MASQPGIRQTAGSSSAASTGARAADKPSRVDSTADPILRNALRYTISAQEYALLHRYVLSRSRFLKRRAPSVETVQKILHRPPYNQSRTPSAQPARPGEEGQKRQSKADPLHGSLPQRSGPPTRDHGSVGSPSRGADDYNARAVRHSLRVFLATGALMKFWGMLSGRLTKKNQGTTSSQKKQPFYKSPTLRLSLSLSTILLLYRILFRFFVRLRAHLLDPSAAPFRRRNPRTTRALTSSYTPSIGASLAGLALGIYPAKRPFRAAVAIYALFRALEFAWNAAEDGGAVWGWERAADGSPLRRRTRPWWWGSWMLQPFAFGQLLHAVVFDRDCFPKPYGDFILGNTTAYLHPKPNDLPPGLGWPSPYTVIDSLAEMARLNWPPFISPILFPNKEDILPPSLTAVAPLTSCAHPLISSLSCATLHPSDPSCTRTFLTFWLRSFPPITRFLLLAYSALLLPRARRLYHAPVATLHALVRRALRTSTFLTGAVSTAWASLCFFQAWLPRAMLPRFRFFLGGFAAGLWAVVDRQHGRPAFLYSARLALDSLWRVGIKRRWWRGVRGGDLWVVVFALALAGSAYERDPRAVREVGWRKGISWVRGEGWRDWGMEPEEDEVEDEDGKARCEDDAVLVH
ncbi:hypothetical protein VTK73DRAFT_3545 [Phialemonium thermophilum]|uniref:Transmembrane protein 135 N-terminal domain-containing protein n=1 Tax=Phialemonium thermophilum TaxID=223376 RepID=A0ABR3XZM7_9PEZI